MKIIIIYLSFTFGIVAGALGNTFKFLHVLIIYFDYYQYDKIFQSNENIRTMHIVVHHRHAYLYSKPNFFTFLLR